MENQESKRSDGDGEFGFPEEIILHIQSFMNEKEASQTSIVSKSWYRAWSTRPNLEIDHRHLRDGDELSEFTNKIMKRYDDLNLKIESFRLWLDETKGLDVSLAKKLIVKAIQLGATDVNIEFQTEHAWFVLLNEMHGSETLARLSLTRCIIDPLEVTCSELKSLYLSQVVLTRGFFSDLVSSCPLIEELTLKNLNMLVCYSLDDLQGGFHKLKKYLVMGVSYFEDSIRRHDFLSGFSCLKELVILDCHDYHEMLICSRSLERISIRMAKGTNSSSRFDVPNIRKFHFEGSGISHFSFGTTNKEWESDIHIIIDYEPDSFFFFSFYRLVRNLSQSKVSLSLHMKFLKHRGYSGHYNTAGLPLCIPPVPAVENLTLILDNEVPASAVTPNFLDDLFFLCLRPNFITQYWFPHHLNNDMLELVVKRLVDKTTRGIGPEEVMNVEVFEERLGEWEALPWETLLDHSACPQHIRMVRLQYLG